MSKYIDAEKLQVRINRMWEERQLTNTKHKTFTELLTLEPEAIVRCKDCKHYKTDHPKANGYHCCWRMHNIFPMKENDFCSYGEKV